MSDTYSVSFTPDPLETGTTSQSTSSDSAPMLAIQAGPSYTCKIATIRWAYSGLNSAATALDIGLQQLDSGSVVRRTNAAGGRFHKVQRRTALAQRDVATVSIALAQPLERQSYTWNTYVAPGAYRWIAIVENQDVTAYSAPFYVTDSGDSSCVDTTLFTSSSTPVDSSVAALPSSSADAFTSSAAEIASSIVASSAAMSSASAAAAASTSVAAGLGSASADTSSSSQHNGVSSGGIAAAIVVPMLVIAAAVVLYLRRRASRADSLNEKSSGAGGSWKEKFLGGGAAASGGHMRTVSSPFDPRQHTGLSSQGAQAGMRRADAGDVLPGTDGAEWVDFSATNSPDARVLSPGQFAHIPEGTEAAARNSAFSDSIVGGDLGVTGGLYQHNNSSLARDSALSGAAHGHSRFDSYSTAPNVRPSSITSHTSAAQEESDAAEAAALQRSVSSASTLHVQRKPVPVLEDLQDTLKHYSSAARSSVDPYSLPIVSSPVLPDASPFSDAHAAASPVSDAALFAELSAPTRPFAASDARDSHISGVPDSVQSIDTPVLPSHSSPTQSPTSRTLVTADSSEDLARAPSTRGDYHLSVNMDKGFRVSF